MKLIFKKHSYYLRGTIALEQSLENVTPDLQMLYLGPSKYLLSVLWEYEGLWKKLQLPGKCLLTVDILYVLDCIWKDVASLLMLIFIVGYRLSLTDEL